MRRVSSIFIFLPGLLLLVATGLSLHAQNRPETPVIQYVSVDTATNNVEIAWHPSGSDSIMSYWIYKSVETPSGLAWEPIDTVDGTTYSYVHQMENYVPLIYSVTARDSLGNENIFGDNYHQPVKLEATYDSCRQQMALSWNGYVGWGAQMAGYRITGRSCCDEVLDVILEPGKRSYIHQGINENTPYTYQLVAFNSQSGISFSNTEEYYTYMPAPPGFINLDYVTVKDDYTVEISFTPDLSGEIDDFLLMKSNSPDTEFTGWYTLNNVDAVPAVIRDDFPTGSNVLYYRVDALNSCGRSVKSSNIASNMLLSGSIEGNNVMLQWTPYRRFGGETEAYNIYRYNDYGENIPAGSVGPGTTSALVDLNGSGTQKGEVTFYVEAIESEQNPHGVRGMSRSNELTLSIESRLHFPNAFTPNMDGRNDLFMPVMDFIPEEYLMMIFDRSGKKIFETRDPLTGWDGTLGNGQRAMQGVYMYHIKYTSFNGIRASKTGNVSLVIP